MLFGSSSRAWARADRTKLSKQIIDVIEYIKESARNSRRLFSLMETVSPEKYPSYVSGPMMSLRGRHRSSLGRVVQKRTVLNNVPGMHGLRWIAYRLGRAHWKPTVPQSALETETTSVAV